MMLQGKGDSSAHNSNNHTSAFPQDNHCTSFSCRGVLYICLSHRTLKDVYSESKFNKKTINFTASSKTSSKKLEIFFFSNYK